MIDLLPPAWILAVVLFWGAIWGSFANVVIARLPRGESLALPASHCPQCKTPIRWYDNLPLISWLVLRGRCRDCEQPIPARYPLVELGGILCSLAAAYAAAGGWDLWRIRETPALEVLSVWMLLTFFFLILLMLTLIDLEHLLLPHRLTITLAILAFVYAIAVPPGGDWRGFVPSPSLWSAGLGFVVAYGGLFAFAMGYQLLTGRQGIGGGDFMLFGALGAWFGWEALPMLMLLAAFQGVLAFVLAQWLFPSLIREAGGAEFWDATLDTHVAETPPDAERTEGRDASVSSEQAAPISGGRGVPFGPFLCLAAIEFVAFGGLYIQWLNGGI